MIDLEAATKLCETLPPGPLSFTEDSAGNPSIFWINYWSLNHEKVAVFYWPTHPPEDTVKVEGWWNGLGAFICAARTLLPLALSELRDLRAENASLRLELAQRDQDILTLIEVHLSDNDILGEIAKRLHPRFKGV